MTIDVWRGRLCGVFAFAGRFFAGAMLLACDSASPPSGAARSVVGEVVVAAATHPLASTGNVGVERWERVQAPAARERHAMTYDGARGRLVVFGGAAGDVAPALNDTWTSDGGTWTEGPDAPAAMVPRHGHAMAYDALHDRVVVVGGVDANGAALDETWTWDGDPASTWLSAPAAPAAALAGEAVSLAYDDARGRVVLVGSDARTWTWDGTASATWAPGPTMPSAFVATARHSLAFDGARKRLVLFGGNADTWTWDGAASGWVPGPTAPAGLLADTAPPMAFDAARGALVLFGGVRQSAYLDETWTWDGQPTTTWTRAATTSAAPPVRAGHAAAYDATRGRLVVFGGRDATTTLDDTASWDGTQWESGPATPPELRDRTSQAMAEDAVRGRVVLFGGWTFDGVLDDTWTWDGARWHQGPAAPTGLVARRDPAMAAHVARGTVVLFGGEDATGAPLDDTWIWNGSAWTAGPPAPSGLHARRGHAMADDGRGHVLLFGGRGEGDVDFSDTWIWDGDAWSAAPAAPAELTPRVYAGMALDEARSRIVLYGGLGGTTALSDTWLWDGATWTASPSVAAAMPPRVGHAMAYDRAAGRILVFGGGGSTLLDDTWWWDGAAWTAGAAVPSALTPRVHVQMAYDGARRRVVLFGGFPTGNETWLHSTRGGSCATAAECSSGFCVDGVCCDVAACGTCQACNLAAAPGVCSPVRGTPDGDTCAGDARCGLDGQCRGNLGRACTRESGCASGHCVDGVCCDASCEGQCEACDVSGAVGTCSVARGASHGSRARCAAGSDACSATWCDGTRGDACSFVGADTACRAASCVGGVATAVASCTGLGTCGEVVSTSCAPYACAGDRCATACKDPGDCDGTSTCGDAGTCVTRPAVTCDGDHTLTSPEGAQTDCGTYACQGSTCRTTCSSASDCARGSVCTAERCGPSAASPDAPAAGGAPGCAMARSPRAPRSSALAAGVATIALAWRRWRRRRGRRHAV